MYLCYNDKGLMYGTKLFLTLYINIVLKSAVLKVGSLAFFRTVSPCTKCMFLKTALLVQPQVKKFHDIYFPDQMV